MGAGILPAGPAKLTRIRYFRLNINQLRDKTGDS
jgi:hypothetical protein